MPCVPCNAFELYHIVVVTLAFGAGAINYYPPSMKQRLFTSGTPTNDPYSNMDIKDQIHNPLNASLHCRNIEKKWLKSNARDQKFSTG